MAVDIFFSLWAVTSFWLRRLAPDMTADAFLTQILPLRDKCYRFAASILRNGPESEDVAQDILVRLWERRERLATVDNVEAFAMRATRNLALDRKRNANWRTTNTDVLFDLSTSNITPDVQAEQREAIAAVFNCMDDLPEIQRAILHLREVDQMSYDEIAHALELPVSQVKVYLHRARKKVRTLIDPSHAPLPPRPRTAQTD